MQDRKILFRRLFNLITLVCCFDLVRSQLPENTYSIFGDLRLLGPVQEKDLVIVKKWEIGQNAASLPCFSGMSTVDNSCYLANFNPPNSFATDGEKPESPGVGVLTNSGFNSEGSVSCLECCDNTRSGYDFNETFGIVCPRGNNNQVLDEFDKLLEAGNTPEFRFARRLTLDDTTYISCNLPQPSDEDTSKIIVGYNLTVIVQERSDDSKYWRGVVACRAEPFYKGVDDEWSKEWRSRMQWNSAPCWQTGEPSCFYQQITVTNARPPCQVNFNDDTCLDTEPLKCRGSPLFTEQAEFPAINPAGQKVQICSAKQENTLFCILLALAFYFANSG